MGTFNLGKNKWATKKGGLLASVNTPKNNLAYTPFKVVRGSTATYFDRTGIMQTAEIDEPRIDFTDDSEGYLLTEPQSTNLALWSEAFNEFHWNKGGSSPPSIIPNDTTAPDGTLTADKIVFTDTGNGLITQNITVLNTTVYSLFIWIKGALGGETVALGFKNTASQGTGTGDFTITNKWVKYELKNTTSIQTNLGLQILIRSGFGDANIYIWGAQLEQLSYLTTYIKTESATVTRLADAITDAGNSEVFNSVEGVLYCEISALADDGSIKRFCINNGTSSNQVLIGYHPNTNVIQVIVTVGGVAQFNVQTVMSDTTIFHKVALKYKEDDFAVWINGVKGSTDLSGVVFAPNTLNSLDFNNGAGLDKFYGKTKQIQVFPTALTDAELKALTT